MDVELLAKMIKEVITDHDEVGLPGVGTFVAEVVPATFSDKGFTINPPYRRLSFHPNRSEDKLLVDLYARSNDIAPEAANAYLSQFLMELKTVLKERKIIVLPGLGRLRATKENNFFFVSDEGLDIFPDGFGLEPVSLKTVHNPEPVNISETFAEIVGALSHTDEEPQEIIEPIPTPEPEPTPEPAPQPDPVPEPTPEPEPAPEPDTAAATDSEPQPEPEVEPAPAPEPQPQPRRRFRWWLLVLVLLALAGIALMAFLILADVAPDLIDSILYTPEELRIINY